MRHGDRRVAGQCGAKHRVVVIGALREQEE
jgi:hypothetical protein